MEPQAPQFNYKVLATHNDALSRQINEAVHIRAKGDMNSKQEFASNELIRLESKNYSWEERKLHKLEREEEMKTTADIENFINVMKMVHKCTNKRKIITLNDYRSKNGTSQSSKLNLNKRLKMATSTPTHYRDQPLIDLDESPVTVGEIMDITASDTSSKSLTAMDSSGKVPKVISKAIENLKITPLKEEASNKTRARLSVTANEHSDSQEFFRKRLNTVPVPRRKNYINTAKLMGRSNSMEDIDFSEWNSGDSLGIEGETVVTDEDFWDDKESYGISLLFAEQEVRDQVEERGYIEEMTKNKLYEIFIKMCPNRVIKVRGRQGKATGLTGVLATPEKRKASPLPELDKANPAKTACCYRNAVESNRSQSIGSSPRLRRTKKAMRPRTKSASIVPKGQQTMISWCRQIKK